MENTNEQRVADFIVDFLLEREVENFFLLTGNGAMYLNDAIAKQPGIKYFTARNEAAAPMMAESYARMTGKLGVVCVTSGPGATNAISGLAEAWVDSAPVLIISGQAPTDQIPVESSSLAVRTFGTAAIDVVSAVKSLTKYAVTIKDPNSIRYHMEKAFHLALTGRPGPVWIDVPMDVQYALVNPLTMDSFLPEIAPDFSPSTSEINKVKELLNHSERPLIVGGQGLRQGQALSAFQAFLNKTGIPTVFSRLGQDILPYSHAQNMGSVGRRGAKYSREILSRPDLIISLGSRLPVQLAGNKLEHFSPEAKIIMVDIDAAELDFQGERIALPICADVNHFLENLNSEIDDLILPNWSTWLIECQKMKSENPMEFPSQQTNFVDLYEFMASLDANSISTDTLITDAGSNYYVGGQVYKFEHGQREITSGTNAAMGLTIPLAIGAAVAMPGNQILAVTGDGSLELNIQELKTINYYNFNIKLFVINNGGYASMRNWQDTFFAGRRIGSDDETGTDMLDLSKVADTFEIAYDSIDYTDDLDDKICQILQKVGPTLIEVVCDPNQRLFQPFLDTSLSS